MRRKLRIAAATMVAIAALVLGAVGWAISQSSAVASAAQPNQARAATGLGAADPDARPHVVEPTAGIAGVTSSTATDETPNGAAIDRSATSTTINPNAALPVSDAVIRQELASSGTTANLNQATLTPSLLAVAPIDAPLAVQEVIQAGNEIARLPYVWGGGHGSYADTGYDCSGSISYVFAAAHLLNTTLVSGELANWGDPGPGKWITIFANAGHTFMYVAGLRFDTVALAETGSRWSQRPADESNLGSFAIRHPPGL